MNPRSGISLIEVLVVLAVLGVLLAMAMPSMSGLVQRQRLSGAAEAFRSDFQLARMQALGSGRTVRVAFFEHPAGSCYLVHLGAIGSCQCLPGGAPQCAQPQQLLAHHWLPQSRGLRLSANVKQMSIDGQRGTVTPTATIELRNARGDRLVHVVAITGRLRSCGLGFVACSA